MPSRGKKRAGRKFESAMKERKAAKEKTTKAAGKATKARKS